MKTCKKLFFSLFALFFLFSVVFLSCKKDNNDDDTPKNIKNYSGITDWGKPVSFKTAEIGNDLYVTEFSIELYDSVPGEIHSFNWSEGSTSGVIKFNSSMEFSYSDVGNKIDGKLESGGSSVNGNYTYEFESQSGAKQVNGTYTTTKQ